jgi:hypothetical protein
LRVLVHSDREQAVRAAAWIISELGEAARSLRAEIAFLIRHPLRYARFFALDAVLMIASSADGLLIAEAIRLMTHQDKAIRWKAMSFLSRATPQQLKAGLRSESDFRIARLVRWLLDVSSPDRAADIIAALGDPDPLVRRFAAAAAARMVTVTRMPLTEAVASADSEVASFAQDMLRIEA